MSGEPGSATQQTLAGRKIEQQRRTCDVYDDEVCGKPAAFDLGDVVACRRCAAEITEPEHPGESEKARELRGREKFLTEGSA
ncbi:hypothetical protein [Halobaculum sp. P14]|uniref:hypothetical protein n=1 Tax=Halobaculum sp. P14 TaxID=3421638 RepID=UPI003EBCFFFA